MIPMKVRIEGIAPEGKNKTLCANLVILNIFGAREVVNRHSLDFCISQVAQWKEELLGDCEIENAEELLLWLHYNCSMQSC